MSTKRDILEICCKVLGLFYLIQSVVYVPYGVSALAEVVKHSSAAANEQVPWVLPGMIAMPVVVIAAAFFLLKCSKGIASLLIREDGPVQVSTGEDWQRSLYTLCLRVVGAIVLVKGIPELIRVVPEIAFHQQLTRPQISVAIWARLFSAIVYIALGIYFIGGAKLIVRIALKGTLRERDSDKSA